MTRIKLISISTSSRCIEIKYMESGDPEAELWYRILQLLAGLSRQS